MLEMKIEVDISELKQLAQSFSPGLTEAAFPNTTNAVITSQHYIYQRLTDYLSNKGRLDGIENLEKVNRSIIDSVKEKKNGDLDYSVYSDSKQLESIINGRKEVKYDMKKTHPYGRKSRVNKKGVPYLIIPFRWGSPNGKGTKRRWNNVIPQKEYKLNLLPLELSERNNLTHFEKNARGENIQRSNYNWGGRLREENAWNDRSIGMVRMRDIKGSTYFTFRVISAKSAVNKWWYKRDSVPGVDILGALNRTVESDVRQLIQQGIENDEKMYKN